MIGIIGGTFDPPHFGHLRLAEELAQALDLREVRFIPAGLPPHRSLPLASALQRLEMVRLGLAGNPHLVLDTREIDRLTPAYSVETLLDLRRELGEDQSLCLFMGSDVFPALTTWHRWRELFGLAHIVVAQRPGYPGLARAAATMSAELRDELNRRLVHEPEALKGQPAGCVIVQTVTALDISATQIRSELAAGRSPRYLLPQAVLDYIQTNSLYKDIDGN